MSDKADKYDELLGRGIDQVIPQAELEKKLASGKKLRIKFGLDPTRPDIHLGHAVILRKLREFQDMGHTVIFLVGDYTTKIGDPSGRNKTRPMLDDAEIAKNLKSYLDQVGLILDVKKAEIRYNSEWLSKLTMADVLKLSAQMSVAQLIERDDFAQRLASNNELGLHELMYPLLVSYDSVVLEADVEFGGTDQLFNLLAGRALQKKLGQEPQAVVVGELLVGLDGSKKMSKSLDNYIGITDAPADMYGKVMSLPDEQIGHYYELATSVPRTVIDEVIKTIAEGANPRDVKASLAREIVTIYHDAEAAQAAEAAFTSQFRDGALPEEIKDFKSAKGTDLVDILVESDLASSKSEARRLIAQSGVRINGEVWSTETEAEFEDGDIVQVGKRRFIKLRLRG